MQHRRDSVPLVFHAQQ